MKVNTPLYMVLMEKRKELLNNLIVERNMNQKAN